MHRVQQRVNVSNIDTAYATAGLARFRPPLTSTTSPSTTRLSAQGDFEEFKGVFGQGSIIVPLGFVDGAASFDTSWTNAGFVNGSDVVINPTAGAPEPATWLMLGIGFASFGAFYRRRSTGRLATL